MKSTITKIRKVRCPASVIDIEVADNHNMFVEGVLTHNCQKFYRQPPDAVPKLLGNRSMLVVDECHTAAAVKYAQFISRIPAIHRMGLSATTERKDTRDKINAFLLGPVVAEATSVTLTPSIKWHEVEAAPKRDYSMWSAAVAWASESEERNAEIVENVLRDIKDGHHSVIVPVLYKRHMEALLRLFNKRALEELGVDDLAIGLHATAKRAEVLSRADNATKKRPCVLVAISSIIKQGITLKAASALHLAVPMSGSPNVGAPMFRQTAYRTATPVPGKKPPSVTLYVDKIGMFRSAIRSLLRHEIAPRAIGGQPLYTLGKHDATALRSALAGSAGLPKGATGKRSYVAFRSGAWT